MIGARKGFTLMELLVVMGVFSVTVMMTSGIFLLTNRAQRRTISITQAQSDIRYAMEAMVREVRSGRIDFEAYGSSGGIPVPTQRLALRNAAGQLVEFSHETSTSVCPPATNPCLSVRVDGSSPQAVTSAGVTIDTLAFYVSPQVDPFTPDATSGLYASDLQPSVTIVLSARTTGVGAADVQTINAQTTVASRTYVR